MSRGLFQAPQTGSCSTCLARPGNPCPSCSSCPSWFEKNFRLGLIGAIGRPQFEDELACYLNQICGAEHVHVFWLAGGVPDVIASISRDGSDLAKHQTQSDIDGKLWRFDRSMAEGGACSSAQPVLFHLDAEKAGTRELRQFYHAMRLPVGPVPTNRDSGAVKV